MMYNFVTLPDGSTVVTREVIPETIRSIKEYHQWAKTLEQKRIETKQAQIEARRKELGLGPIVELASVVVERMDGEKCPRCWRYWGVPELPQGICDRCAEALLQSEAEDFFDLPADQESFRRFQDDIRAAYQKQISKYLTK